MQICPGLTLISVFLTLLSGSVTSSPQEGITSRSKRYFVYPPPTDLAPTKVQLIIGLGLPMEVDVSMIIGYVMKFNYNLPYNASYLTSPYVRYDRSINRNTSLNKTDENLDEEIDEPILTRWELYEILESIFETSRSGKACLLKMICDAADVPINKIHGLTGELLHVALTPSSTSDPYRTDFDREYQGAEIAGRENPGQCENLFPECTESLLDYVTEIF
ncbi:uncharacterized protein [Prorops nasuta]|uniref:uncharacterized protein n=1 Tax=Prorops nasuta TaxID=863751 RepID=UPI0034CE5E0E